MIGEDLHLTGGTFNITRTPDSMPTYLNDLVVDFTELADSLSLRSINGSRHPFAYRVESFSGGSDHLIFNDGALRVPSVMFGHGDTFHHTSLDTPDKVDPSELRRVCFITLGSLYHMASAEREEALRIARLTVRNGLARLSADYYDELDRLLMNSEKAEALHASWKQLRNRMAHSVKRESDSVLSAGVFSKEPALADSLEMMVYPIKKLAMTLRSEAEDLYRRMCGEMKTGPVNEPAFTDAEKAMQMKVPVRSPDFVCPLQNAYLVDRLGEDAPGDIRLRGYAPYEALNFMDGKRSVYEIERAVSAEFGPVDIEDVLAFFQLLEQAGLLTWK